MRARTNLSTKEKRRFTISDFRGVDFSSSPLRVQANRATDMTNWICENGINQKRHGWMQVFERLPGRINGIFPYRGENGKTELLIYAGKDFYRACQSDGRWGIESITTVSVIKQKLRDDRIQGFSKSNCLYLVCGGIYWQYSPITGFTRIEPYVPTTTISIDSIDVDDTVRVTLDPVNLLTDRRKNKLIGCALAEESSDNSPKNRQTWRLDGLIDYGDSVKVTVDALQTDSGVETVKSYELTLGEDRKFYFDNQIAGYVSDRDKYSYVSLDSQVITTVPPVKGESNITVEFTVQNASVRNKALINNCRFGTLFGVGGNEDRLFLSGNPAYPNMIFFSEANDFTYFPDTFTATMGTDQSAITGFLRLSDNALATFKEASDSEPSVYYQTGEYRSFYDDNGNLKKITPVFSITAGATGESVINPYVSASVAGDNLILSKNGVFGIEPSSNILTDTRTARERSSAINMHLTRREGLKDAVGVAYRGRYYLSVDGGCYVADSRYKYQPQGSLSYNYEWWYWDHIPARVWAVVDGALWFGTEDGRICRFDEAYTDRTFETTKDAEIGVENNRITYGAIGWEPKENDAFKIKSEGAYLIYGNGGLIQNGSRFKTDPIGISEIYEGDEICVETVVGGTDGIIYTVTDVDRFDNTFALLKDGVLVEEALPMILGRVFFIRPALGKELYVSDVKDQSFLLKVAKDSRAVGVAILPSNPVAEFHRKENVVARWTSPCFDMGTNESSKTLLKLIVSQLPEQGGRLKLGYETATGLREILTKGTGVFSFENMDFTDFSFGTGFQNSYSVKVKENNFNYIVFRLLSDSDTNCSINDLTAIYKINKRNLGVM